MVVVIQECLTSLLLFHRLVDQAGTSISAAAGRAAAAHCHSGDARARATHRVHGRKLIELIVRDGVLIPSIVTPVPNGRYRIAEGRGRAKAVQLLARDGKLEPQIPAVIVQDASAGSRRASCWRQPPSQIAKRRPTRVRSIRIALRRSPLALSPTVPTWTGCWRRDSWPSAG